MVNNRYISYQLTCVRDPFSDPRARTFATHGFDAEATDIKDNRNLESINVSR